MSDKQKNSVETNESIDMKRFQLFPPLRRTYIPKKVAEDMKPKYPVKAFPETEGR